MSLTRSCNRLEKLHSEDFKQILLFTSEGTANEMHAKLLLEVSRRKYHIRSTSLGGKIILKYIYLK
jgi:hypothetical protein